MYTWFTCFLIICINTGSNSYELDTVYTYQYQTRVDVYTNDSIFETFKWNANIYMKPVLRDPLNSNLILIQIKVKSLIFL
jgi:hypothetical protein